MIGDLPLWIELLFILCVMYSILVFHLTNKNSRKSTLCLFLWSSVQALLGYCGFYTETYSLPPRFLLILLPVVVAVWYGVKKGIKNELYSIRDLKYTSLIHMVRIPVEIVLYYLFIAGVVPELMTFAGRNFDIIVGLTAPIISALICYNHISKWNMLVWNILGLILILFIVSNAILSVHSPLQLFAFDQPNQAISYFPFILLPATVVPLVIYTHIMDIMKLVKGKQQKGL